MARRLLQRWLQGVQRQLLQHEHADTLHLCCLAKNWCGAFDRMVAADKCIDCCCARTWCAVIVFLAVIAGAISWVQNVQQGMELGGVGSLDCQGLKQRLLSLCNLLHSPKHANSETIVLSTHAQ